MEDRLIAYLYYFNVTRNYFECHEVAESLWLDTGRPVILKGLIQAAVCLYHLENGNVKGGWRMWQRARGYLAPYLPSYESMDLERLTADIDAVFAQVPTTLYPQVVHSSVITELHLPVVKVHILDVAVAKAVEAWVPPAHPEHD